MRQLRYAAAAAVLTLGVFELLAAPSLVAASRAEEANIIEVGTIVESAVVAPDGKIFISVTGEYEKYGDGYIGVVEGDKVVPLSTALNDPHGLAFWGDALYNADNRGQVWRIDLDGTVTRIADATNFPRKITNFNDIEIDDNGNIYVSDTGDWEARGGAIYRITQDGEITTVLTDEEAWQLISPNGLLMEGPDSMLVLDWTTGNLFRLNLETKAFGKINGGFGNGDGLAWGPDGRLYVANYYNGLYRLDTPESEEPTAVFTTAGLGIASVADIAISPDGKFVVAPDFDGGKVAIVPLP